MVLLRTVWADILRCLPADPDNGRRRAMRRNESGEITVADEMRKQPSTAELATVMAVNALPKDEQLPAKAAAERGEERVSLFWRIFGGTILSIVALAVVTLYQQLAGGLTDVRHELESRAKKDEFNDHRNKIWERLRDMEIKEEQADEAIRERCVRLEQQLRDAEDVRKEMGQELKWLRETTIASLKERAAQIEQQTKAGKEDYQQLIHEVRQLKARLDAGERRVSNLSGRAEASEPR
jgi:hypothetical protein